LASQARSETLQAKRVAKLGKPSEQARVTHCVLDDSFEVQGRYVQNTCKGKRHPHGMPSDKKIILKFFLSDSWFGFASTLSLAKHSNIFSLLWKKLQDFFI